MKTITYLKAGLVSKAAIEAKPKISLNEVEQVKEERRMDVFTKAFLKVRERFVRMHRAQTMTEYALILAGIAIVVLVTYQVRGQKINRLATWAVDNDLLGAAS
jgi:Flp pilus assembly pilin Flp